MSKLRGLVPVALATGFGVLNGYVIFQPAFQDLESKKIQNQEESQSTDLGPDLKDVPVADSSASAPLSTPKPEGTPSETWTRKIWPWSTSSQPTSTDNENHGIKDN